MIRRSDTTVADSIGTPQPGVYITVKRDTGVLATIYDDSGNLMANPFTSGAGGVFVYNISDTDAGTYTEEYRLSLSEGPRKTITVDLTIGGASSVRYAATRVILAALTTVLPAYLSEAGREGAFVWSGANLQSLVAIDTAQAIYVPPAGGNGSTGAWVRKFDGRLNPRWFGAPVDDTNNDAAAINLAYRFAEATAVTGSQAPTLYRGGYLVDLSKGKFYITASLEPLATVKTIGVGGLGWGASTQVRCAAGVEAIRAQAYNTSGATTVDGAPHFSGDALVFEDIYFLGGFDGLAEAEVHGCRAKRAIHFNRCTFDNFAGDGLYAHAIAGGGAPNEGNVNVFRATDCVFTNCRSGVSAQWADANAGNLVACSFMGNRRWGVEDRSFLGNQQFGGHFDANARNAWNTGAAGRPVGYVSQGGNQYYVIDGQEVGASTNAPSGTTADNTWWGYWQGGGASPTTGIPLWSSGIAVRSGGPILVSGSSNSASVYGPHVEINGVSQYDQSATVIGNSTAECVRVSGAALLRNQVNKMRGTVNGMQFDGAVTVGGILNAAGGLLAIGSTTGGVTLNLQASAGQAAIIQGFTDGVMYGEYWPSYPGIAGSIFRGRTVIRIDIGNTVGTQIGQWDATGLGLTAGMVFKVNGTQVLGARSTGWTADTGTAKKTATATYTVGSALTASAAYVQAEATAVITRQALIEAAVRDATQEIKAIKDALIAHGAIGA